MVNDANRFSRGPLKHLRRHQVHLRMNAGYSLDAAIDSIAKPLHVAHLVREKFRADLHLHGYLVQGIGFI